VQQSRKSRQSLELWIKTVGVFLAAFYEREAKFRQERCVLENIVNHVQEKTPEKPDRVMRDNEEGAISREDASQDF
jgi:hypothetical protein